MGIVEQGVDGDANVLSGEDKDLTARHRSHLWRSYRVGNGRVKYTLGPRREPGVIVGGVGEILADVGVGGLVQRIGDGEDVVAVDDWPIACLLREVGAKVPRRNIKTSKCHLLDRKKDQESEKNT